MVDYIVPELSFRHGDNDNGDGNDNDDNDDNNDNGFLISLGEGLTAWIWAVRVVVVAHIAPEVSWS